MSVRIFFIIIKNQFVVKCLLIFSLVAVKTKFIGANMHLKLFMICFVDILMVLGVRWGRQLVVMRIYGSRSPSVYHWFACCAGPVYFLYVYLTMHQWRLVQGGLGGLGPPSETGGNK